MSLSGLGLNQWDRKTARRAEAALEGMDLRARKKVLIRLLVITLGYLPGKESQISVEEGEKTIITLPRAKL